MQDGAENERGTHGPEHSATPVPEEEERNADDRHDDDDVVVVVLLARVGPDGFLDDPPEQIVQARDISEAVEGLPDVDFREAIGQGEERRQRETNDKCHSAATERKDAQREQQERDQFY